MKLIEQKINYALIMLMYKLLKNHQDTDHYYQIVFVEYWSDFQDREKQMLYLIL
jgi:hypothetical protein